MIEIKDIYWAAGFLDGEGYFGRRRSTCFVQATQVQAELLYRLQKLFGGHVRQFQRDQVTGRRYHRWDFHGKKATGLMLTLYSLLSLKRKLQIQKALDAWRNAKGRGNYCHGPNSPERNLAISKGMKHSIAERKRLGIYKNH